MGKVVQTYEFDFKFNDKNASKQLKAISKDMAAFIANMGEAADKVSVFKDLVTYLSNVDKAMSAFKSKNKDIFNDMFGNIDSMLAKEMANVFGVLEEQANTFANLKQRITSAVDSKSDLATLRKIATDINRLYATMGQADPIDINALFVGNGSKEKGTSFEQRIDVLNNALDDFALNFQGVQDKIKSGLFSGGAPERQFATATSQYDKLKKKVEEYYDVLDQRKTVQPGTVKYDGLSAQLDEIVDAIVKIKSVDKDAEYALNDIFGDIEYGEIKNTEEALERVCEVLKIDIPSAAGGSGGGGPLGNIVTDAEYILALAGQIRNMFATLSRRSQLEYNVSINGLDIKALAGADGFVGESTQVASYLDNLFGEFTSFGHTHKGGSASINIQDILTYLDEYEKGLHKLSFIVGGDGIQTLNLDGVKKEDVSKIKELVAALNPEHKTAPLDYGKMKEFQSIIAKFGGEKNALQMWKPEQFDELARYIHQISINAMSALTPLEKMKALLDFTFGKGKIDYSKYEDILSGLNESNARDIYNQITSSEGLPTLNESDPLTMGQINKAIDENIAKFKTLREEAKLTYDNIKNEVSKVMEHLRGGGTTGSAFGFFKQYFPEGEWQRVKDILTDACDGLISVEEVQNRIATEFGIDPDTFDKIPTGSTTQIEEPINKAKTALKEFFTLTDEIQNKAFSFDDAEGNVEIGKYTERLETAQSALIQFAQAGEYTKEELQEMESAFKSAQQRLSTYTTYYDGYGNGNGDYAYTYEEEYHTAERDKERLENDLKVTEGQYKSEREENERLRTEIEELRQNEQRDENQGSVSEISIKEENEALKQQKSLVDEIVKIRNNLGLNASQTKLGVTDGKDWLGDSALDNITKMQKELHGYIQWLAQIEAKEKNIGQLTDEEISKKQQLVEIVRDMDLSVRYKDGSYYSTANFGDYDQDLSEQIKQLNQVISLRKKIAYGSYWTGNYGTMGDTFSGDNISTLVGDSVNQFDSVQEFDASIIGQLVREYQNLHTEMTRCLTVGEQVPQSTLDRMKWFENIDATQLQNILPRLTELQGKITAAQEGVEHNITINEDEQFYDAQIQNLQELIQLQKEYLSLGGPAETMDYDTSLHYSTEELQERLDRYTQLKNGAREVAKLQEAFPSIDFRKSRDFVDIADALRQGGLDYQAALKMVNKELEKQEQLEKERANIQSTNKTEEYQAEANIVEQNNDALKEKINLLKEIAAAHSNADEANAAMDAAENYSEESSAQKQLEKAKDELKEFENAYYSAMITMQDGTVVNLKLGDMFSEEVQSVLADADKIKNIDLVPASAKTAMEAYESLERTMTQVYANVSDPDRLEYLTGHFRDGQIDNYSMNIAKALDDIKAGDPNFELIPQEQFDKAVATLEKLNKLRDKSSLEGMFGNAYEQLEKLGSLDIIDEDKLNESWLEVMKGIREGTFTTVDQCMAKFKELTGISDDVQDTISHDSTVATGLTTGTSAGKEDIAAEIQQLERLKTILLEVEQAVQSKTQAFRDEGLAVEQTVSREIEALRELVLALAYIKSALDTINDSFTGGSNALKLPAGADVVNESELVNTPGQNSYVLETTLQATNGYLKSILEALSGNKAIDGLVEPLKNTVAELKNVASGIVEHQKAQQTDKSAASARIANNYGQLSSITGNALSGMGNNIQIENMKALADNIVRVRGAVQDTDGVWKGFVVDINESNNAVISAIDEQSAFAKSLNETAEAAKKAGSGAQEAGPADKFAQSLSSTKSAFNEYRKSLQDVDYLNDEVKQSFNDLAIRLGTISDADGLKDWKDDFGALKDEISVAQEVFEKVELDKVQKLRGQLNSEFKNLDFMTTTSNPTSEQQEILDLRKKLLTQLEEYKLGVKNGKEVELDAINQTMAALRQKINVYRETNDLASGGKQKFGATAVLNATAKYNSLSQQASSGEFANSSVVQQALKQYETAYNNLITKRKELAQVEGSLTDTQKAEFKALTDECNKAAKSLSKIITDSQKLQFVNPEPYFLGEDFDNSIEARKTALTDFVQQMYGVTVSAEDFRDNWNEVVFAVDNGDGTFTNMTATFNAARTQIGALAGDVKKTTGVFESFFNELKGKFKSIGAYMIATVSIHDVIRVVRQGVQYVKEIDLALTELKKVTDETEQSYDNFLNTASQTASKIGSTVADFTNATADFARLGYNMEQAAELAKAASVYKNVGDGINDIATASESIISTMKAFGIEADSAMGIVDRFNEVGNNFAISSTGIGEAMQRSASALYAAGNTIDESIALITGANSVVQNPEQVGTALKTLSLRLRGAKVELEEAGLETDNMAESTAKLQADLKALTHGKVDIMLDADTFKSTTQIIREMSQAWEDMTDIERAAALELMGGKRQANILSSLITNFETVEEVIKTSVSSSGSAMSENEKYLSSIQGKIELFTNSIQTMWMNTLNDDVIKFFIDVGAAAVQLVDKLGLIPTLLGSFVGFKLTSNVLKKYFDDTSSSAHTTYGKFKELINAEYEEAQASKKNTAANQEEANAHNQAAASEEREEQSTRELASADAAETKESLKNASANRIEADAHNATSNAEAGETSTSVVGSVSTGVVSGEISEEVAEEFVEQGLKKGTQGVVKEGAEELSEEITEEIAEQGFKQVGKNLAKEGLEEIGEEVAEAGAKMMFSGLAGSGIKKIFGKLTTKLAGSGIKKALGSVLGSVLGGIGGAIISSIAFDLIGQVWGEITEKIVTSKEAKELADNAISQYSTDKKSLAEQKKVIDELSKSYENLSKGVNINTNDNVSLTAESYEEYLGVCNQIADMYPHLVTGFDAQGNAILSLRGNVDELIQAYRDANQAARQAMLDNGDHIFKSFKNTVFDDDNTNYDSSGLTDQIEVAQKLIEAINTDDKDKMQSAFDYVYNNKRNALMEMTKSAGLELGDFRSWLTGDVDVESFKGTAKTLLSFVKSTTSQINTETSKVKSLLDAYLGEDLDYASYSDKTRSYIDQIVASLDADFVNGFDSADALYNYIKTNIVDVFKDPSITNALSELSQLQLDFNKGDISYADYQTQLNEYIGKIQNKFDSETLAQIKIGIGIDEASLQTAENHIATMVDGFDDEGKIIQDVQNKINSLSVEDLQIAGQLEVPEGTIYTWDELIVKINEVKAAAAEDFDLSDYKTAITSITESISTYQEAIQKLDKGSFTLGDFMELIEDMPDLAKGVDISSKSFSGLRQNLQKAIKTSTKSFVNDLKELKYRLEQTGKSTEAIDQLIDAVNNMPDDALDSFVDKYSTLADEIERANTAQSKLSESMGEEETGYETRGEAMEYMKGKLEEGKIGSESNVWKVAEQYGFTYDSAKSINENADALAKYIAVRERWFKEADDGDDRTDDGYAFEGIENFIQDVETATEKSEELQKYLSWTYDESTGTLNFDFDNENLDTIIQSLSKTEQFAGLTKEEFIDMIRWVGQYFNINWGDNDDILNYLDGVATSAKDAKTKVEEYGVAMQKYLGGQTTIDLTQRPMVSKEKMQEAGWKNFDGTYGTTYSSTYTSEDGQKSIVVTPILPDGSVLSPEELDGYAKKLLNGEEIDPKINIKLGEFNGKDSQKQADEYAQTLSKAQAQYDKLRDTLNINTTLDSKGIDGLKEIKELQETITTNSEGVTVIDPEAFTKTLKDAGYTQDQIDLIIDKIKKLNSESFNSDLFKIDETLVNDGVSGLQKIQELQSAIKESSSGWTVVDTDMFASVLQGAGYTKTQIDELIKKIQEYNSVVLTSGNTDPLGLDATNMSIDTLKASLDTLGVKFSEQYGTLGDGLKDIKIDVPNLVTMLNEKGWSEEAIRNYCAKLSETNLEGFQIKVDQKEIDAAIEKANEVPAEKPINVEITGTALTDAQNINSELNKMQDRTVEVTINETTVKKTEEDDGFNLFKPTTWFANGTAHASGSAFADGNWGAPSTETALVGELGPELLVRGNRWTTIGENGAEFTQVKKGDIIFNHKQTESLLKNGYVTSRGRAYASGTAYANTGGDSTFAKYHFSGDGGYTKYDVNDNVVDKFGNAADKLSDAADKVSDSSDEFKEAVDWIEVRIEEINERLSLKEAQLGNTTGAAAKNKIIDSMIADNQMLYDNLLAGANEYYSHAKTLLGKIPAQFRDAAKDGSIAITEFVGDTSEEAYNAIQEYRDWVQKGADLTQQAEETLTQIRDLAIQRFENSQEQGDAKVGYVDDKNAKIEAAIGLAEEKGIPVSSMYYEQLIANTNDKKGRLVTKRDDLQKDLDKAVEKGEVKKFDPKWYEMVSEISAVDEEIIQCNTDIEGFKNSIDELYWDNIDTVAERIDNVSEEAQELIDILGEKDLVDEAGNFTDEGITTLGLYAQQMENAKFKVQMYQDAINSLNDDYAKGKISESEYAEKLADLKDKQYDSIKAYNDTKKSIADVQKTRVEAIKKGIDKEIEAYEQLIKKKKEELDSEKDLYDFRKKSQESTKNIAEIERKLAALAGDNSMAAQAKRARLEAELAEAKAEQEDMYYERSVSNQQEAYDKSLENFTEEKEAEKEKWDEWLENTNDVVRDAFEFLEDNAEAVNETLKGLADEYGIKLSDAIVNPWTEGQEPMSAYWSSFTTLGTTALDALSTELTEFHEALSQAEEDAQTILDQQTLEQQTYIGAKYEGGGKGNGNNGNGNNGNGNGGKNNTNPPKVGSSVTVKSSATHFSAQSGSKKMASFVPGGTYTVYETMGSGNNAQVLIGKNGAYTGWVKLTDLKGYAKGTLGIDEDQFAWIDELGEELVLQADGNGRLKYMTKGSSVIPHDITENLMSWGELDPSNMLEQNRPSIGISPEVHNTEINLDCSVGTLVNIEHCDQGTLPDVEKMVNKAFEKHMQNLNNSIKKYVR